MIHIKETKSRNASITAFCGNIKDKKHNNITTKNNEKT